MCSLTEHRQALVQRVVKGPDVGGPVGVTEAPLEGEEAGEELRELTLKHTSDQTQRRTPAEEPGFTAQQALSTGNSSHNPLQHCPPTLSL